MTITKNSTRQELVTAYVDFGLEDLVGNYVTATSDLSKGDLTDGAAYTTNILLPVGAVVTAGSIEVIVPFDSTVSDDLIVGDASDDNRYLTSCDLSVVDTTPLVPTGFIHTAGEPALKVTWNTTGTAPTEGRFLISVTYYIVADVVEKTTNILYSDLTTATAYTTALTTPVGAVVVGGEIDILTAFNSQTSDVIVVGDASTANRYVASTDIHTGASTPIAFVPTGFVATSTQSAIKVTWTKVGTAPSAGALAVTVRYYVLAEIEAIDLPHNAILISGDVTVKEAFDSETSDAIDVGDAALVTRYKSAGDLQTLGRIALVPTGFVTTGVTPVTVRWKRLPDDTAPTVGQARLTVSYAVKGRGSFSQE